MKFTFLLILTVTINVFAAASNEILIEGTIKSFDKNLVLVTDTFGQSFRIPKKMFSGHIKIATDNFFSFEISGDAFNKLEQLKTHK